MACENATVNKIAEVLNKKSAADICVLDVRGLTTLCDYFIIAEGKTERQTKALCDSVEEELGKDGIFHVNKEGYQTGDWILVGYDEAIVHIFKPESRSFYNLEHVWQDSKRIDMSDIID